MATSSQDVTADIGLAGLAQAPIQAIAAWQTAFSLPIALAAEGLRFAGQRMLANAEHLAELSRCRDLPAAVEGQSAFAQTMATAYREEADVLVQKIQDLVPTYKAAA
jgi:hypothetical protein